MIELVRECLDVLKSEREDKFCILSGQEINLDDLKKKTTSDWQTMLARDEPRRFISRDDYLYRNMKELVDLNAGGHSILYRVVFCNDKSCVEPRGLYYTTHRHYLFNSVIDIMWDNLENLGLSYEERRALKDYIMTVEVPFEDIDVVSSMYIRAQNPYEHEVRLFHDRNIKLIEVD